MNPIITNEDSKKEMPSAPPAKYQDLFKLDPALLQQLKNKSIDVIVLEFGIAECRLHVENKRLVFEIRRIGQHEQEHKVKEKIDNYDRYLSLFGSGTAGCLNVVSIFVNPVAAPILTASAKIVDSTSDYTNRRADGKGYGLEHLYQRESSLISEHSQNMREADQNFDRTLSLIDRVQYSIQKAWENLVSAAAG